MLVNVAPNCCCVVKLSWCLRLYYDKSVGVCWLILTLCPRISMSFSKNEKSMLIVKLVHVSKMGHWSQLGESNGRRCMFIVCLLMILKYLVWMKPFKTRNLRDAYNISEKQATCTTEIVCAIVLKSFTMLQGFVPINGQALHGYRCSRELIK